MGKVLIVDDERTIGDYLANLITRLGHQVEVTLNASDTLAKLDEGGFQLVIADIRLPDMTGYELLLKLMELMDHVPLILMSSFGWDPGHSIVNARRAGLHPKAILYKPFRLEQLLETVETIVDIRADISQVS